MKYMFDLTEGRKGCITIAGDPMVEGDWYNGHLANTAFFADPTPAHITAKDAPPELLVGMMTYEEMVNQRNNLKVMPNKYKGTTTGLALVTKKCI